jgi:CheY-like chemotaxis protein
VEQPSTARILVADDEGAVRRLVVRVLTAEGYEVSEAVDGADALAKCASDPPDVLVCDVFMPDKDGLEVIHELRKTAPGIKILVYSGGGRHAFMAPLEMGRMLGAAASLKKPFSSADLLEAVRDLLRSTG